jgi:uncharacterized membrane protein
LSGLEYADGGLRVGSAEAAGDLAIEAEQTLDVHDVAYGVLHSEDDFLRDLRELAEEDEVRRATRDDQLPVALGARGRTGW